MNQQKKEENSDAGNEDYVAIKNINYHKNDHFVWVSRLTKEENPKKATKQENNTMWKKRKKKKQKNGKRLFAKCH